MAWSVRRSVGRAVLWLAALVVPGPCLAGAFLQPEGHGQIILDKLSAKAKASASASPEAVPLSSWAKREWAAAFEFGATDWATITARGSWDALAWRSCICAPVESARGVGAGALGTRLALWQVPNWTASFEIERSWAGTGARQWTGAPDSVASTGLRLQSGYNFAWFEKTGFVEAAVGTRFLASPFAAEQQIDLTFGVRPVPKVLLLAQEFVRWAPPGGPLPARFSSKMQFSTVYFRNSRYAVHVGIYDTIRARGIAPERGIVTGIWYRF